MKYIKLFEDYLDEILDKITKSGINSLTDNEKKYLNANSFDNKEEMAKIEREVGKRKFTSSNNLFSFELDRVEDFGDEVLYYGTIYLPDITYEKNERTISGEIEGVIEYRDGVILPNFQKKEYGVTWDSEEFIEGLEHEFFQFLQEIIDELEEE